LREKIVISFVLCFFIYGAVAFGILAFFESTISRCLAIGIIYSILTVIALYDEWEKGGE